MTINASHASNRWYEVEIVGTAGNIKVYEDGVMKWIQLCVRL
jgi:hypothetical protein